MLAAIVEASDDAILSVTLEGIITTWNNSAERMFGYSAEEILGKPAATLVPAHLIEEENYAMECLRHGLPAGHFETVRLHKDGAALHVSLSVSAIRDAARQIVGAAIIARDISKRKQAEDEPSLRQSIGMDAPPTREQHKLLWQHPTAFDSREKVFHFLTDLTKRLGRIPDAEEMLSMAVKAVGTQLGASCCFAELDVEKGVAHVYHDSTTDAIGMVGTHEMDSFGKEILEALRQGRGIVNEDAAADARTTAVYETDYAPLQIRSFVIVPLLHEDQLVGFIHVRYPEARQWRPDEIFLLGQVVEQISRPAQSARLQRELRSRAQYSESLLNALPIGIVDSYAQLQRHILIVKEQRAALELQKRQLEEANVQLEALATTDSLTGLKNHRTFQERLREEIYRAARYNVPLSLLLLDVDHFKSYNDTYGHPSGDSILRRVAEILQATARATDLVTRYGGEAFAIILVGADSECAKVAAERFRQAIESAPWQERRITASLGVATLSTPDAAALISRADQALYRAKRRGRNCVSLETDTITARKGNPSGVQDIYDAMIGRWSSMLDLRDKEGEGHSERVAEMMVRLARAAGMTEENIVYAKWGARLHDIGKIGVPDIILNKPGPLTDEEWAVMQEHPTVAYEMLSSVTFLAGPALDIPHYHHEKWDGTGYPSGLKGDAIPLSARLFAVVDVYDALRSDRPYRRAWEEEKVRDYLRKQAGTHLDPEAVEVFLACTQ